jgi:hypothetical protein
MPVSVVVYRGLLSTSLAFGEIRRQQLNGITKTDEAVSWAACLSPSPDFAPPAENQLFPAATITATPKTVMMTNPRKRLNHSSDMDPAQKEVILRSQNSDTEKMDSALRPLACRILKWVRRIGKGERVRQTYRSDARTAFSDEFEAR